MLADWIQAGLKSSLYPFRRIPTDIFHFPWFYTGYSGAKFSVEAEGDHTEKWGKWDPVKCDHLPKNCAFSPTVSFFNCITKHFFLPFPHAFPFPRSSPHPPPPIFSCSPPSSPFSYGRRGLGDLWTWILLGLNCVHVACWLLLLLVAACGTGSRPEVHGIVSETMSSLLVSTLLAYSIYLAHSEGHIDAKKQP